MFQRFGWRTSQVYKDELGNSSLLLSTLDHPNAVVGRKAVAANVLVKRPHVVQQIRRVLLRQELVISKRWRFKARAADVTRLQQIVGGANKRCSLGFVQVYSKSFLSLRRALEANAVNRFVCASSTCWKRIAQT